MGYSQCCIGILYIHENINMMQTIFSTVTELCIHVKTQLHHIYGYIYQTPIT